jgi:hypothetical protein
VDTGPCDTTKARLIAGSAKEVSQPDTFRIAESRLLTYPQHGTPLLWGFAMRVWGIAMKTRFAPWGIAMYVQLVSN